jgi:hypothetical protein
MYKTRLVLFIAGLIFLAGCAIPPPPTTYVETAQPEWKVISIRGDLDYDKAWQLLVDHMQKNYDMEKVDKDTGHMRTDWILDPAGDDRDDYKVRITVKFTDDRKKLKLKTDALYHKVYEGQLTGTIYEDYGWIPGGDTKVLNEVYGDISGLVG